MKSKIKRKRDWKEERVEEAHGVAYELATSPREGGYQFNGVWYKWGFQIAKRLRRLWEIRGREGKR